MLVRSRTEFASQDEWTVYVRNSVPIAEHNYVLARGRTELFKSFYEVRKQQFPAEYIRELELNETLSEPRRTDSLERLNERILAGLTELLFHNAYPKQVKTAPHFEISPREQVQDLLTHLAEKNPYFSLWADYKRGLAGTVDAQAWEQYLSRELGPEDEDAIDFTKAMADLDKLLFHYWARNAPLPPRFFERTWFLHYLRGPERMLQTRTLLTTLATEIGECTSA